MLTHLRRLALTLLAPALLALTPEAQATTVTDVVIAFDGSSSLDGQEFFQQTQGIFNAIRNQAAVPQDGTFGLGIVQFGTTVSTVAAYGVVTAANIDNDFANRVYGAVQASGETNTGGAIDLAQSLLPTGGSARQSIILVTDGAPNVPAGSATTFALQQASEAKAAGIEIYVIAVGAFGGDTSVVESISSGSGYFAQLGSYTGSSMTIAMIQALNTLRGPETPPPPGGNPVPEPTGLVLAAVGLAGVLSRRRA